MKNDRRKYSRIIGELMTGRSCEGYDPMVRLVILGAGHVGMCAAKLACDLGYEVLVMDDREDFLQRERFPEKVELKYSRYEEDILSEGKGYYLVATRGPATDEKCVLRIMEKAPVYCGMLGSNKKADRIRKKLEETGISKAGIEAFHAPVGMRIGAETPMEIAVSILGEIIQCIHKRNYRFIESEIVEVFSEALRGNENASFMEEVPVRSNRQNKGVMVTILDTEGTLPRKKDSRMLVLPDGSFKGSVGGGPLEGHVLRDAAEILENDKDKEEIIIREYDMVTVSGQEFAAAGGGSLRIMFEIQEW